MRLLYFSDIKVAHKKKKYFFFNILDNCHSAGNNVTVYRNTLPMVKRYNLKKCQMSKP